MLLVITTGCDHEAEAPVHSPAEPQQMTHPQEVTLYYPSPALLLAPEQVELELPEIETFAVESIIEELLGGMSSRWPGGFVPEDTTVRAAYILDDTAIVDIDAPPLTEGWTVGSKTELLAVQSIVHSIVTNFEEIDSVQILVNGGEVSTFAGHIDLSKPLRPDRSLVAGR